MKIKDKAIWIIKLPTRAELLVEVGDKVEVNQVLADFKSHTVETFSYSSLRRMDDNKRKELNQFFKDKLVKEGEVFWNIGVFKSKVCFPLTGLCLGFDEFKNLRIERVEDEKRKILSPIKAKVIKISDGKLGLEFKAREYIGEGLNGMKSWGEGEIKIVDEIKDLNYELDNNVLFTNNLTRAFLLKAMVLGIKGVVTMGNYEIKDMDIKLPVLRLDDDVWTKFMEENYEKRKKMLVNAKMNKLLLVLE